ncbi:MAG: autoinducer binding domain-containing protein [Roseiarcus sp.]|jgi:hypothetical protein
MSRWDETVDFARRFQLAQSAEAICRELLALTSRYGLTSFVAGAIPAPGSSPAAQKSGILFGQYNEAWLRRYSARNYAYVDPLPGIIGRSHSNHPPATELQPIHPTQQVFASALSVSRDVGTGRALVNGQEFQTETQPGSSQSLH